MSAPDPNWTEVSQALAPWVAPAIIVTVMLFLHKSLKDDLRDLKVDLKGDLKDLKTEIRNWLNAFDQRLGRMERAGSRERQEHVESQEGLGPDPKPQTRERTIERQTAAGIIAARGRYEASRMAREQRAMVDALMRRIKRSKVQQARKKRKSALR